jgi:soluble lytic murein transglycosylase-like protein
VVACSVAAELTLLQRPAPVADLPFKEQPRFTERHVAAVIDRRAPRMDDDLRDRLSQAVMVEAGRAGYDPLFVLALIGVESNFRVRAESERGAQGLIQLKPSTFAWINAREPDIGGGDLMLGDDPIVDVKLAVRYFRWLETRFKSRDAALYAYNAGPRRARRPLTSGVVPEKLKDYANRVRREHQKLSRMAEGITPLPEPARTELAMRLDRP